MTTKLSISTLKYRAILLYVLIYVNSKARKHQQLNELNNLLSAHATDLYTLPICGILVLLYEVLIGTLAIPVFKQTTKTTTDSNNVEHLIKHKNDRYGIIHGTRFITTHQLVLHNTLQYLYKQNDVSVAEQLLPGILHGNIMSRRYQRYARINTLLSNKDDIKQILQQMNYRCVESIDNNNTTIKQYCYDAYINNLIQFSANDNDIIHSDLVKSNQLIIQDKSSCLPCIALNPQPNSIMIDACSAPGNKSSLCAALINNNGTIYAVERDRKRCKLMNERMIDFNAKCVQTINCSFLDIDPHDSTSMMSQARYILLDPSCSGSGTINVDRLLGDDYDSIVTVPPVQLNNTAKQSMEPTSQRIHELHDSQVELLQHAMSFKHVERISYSTCSIYELENECVIHDVLPYAHQYGFKLAHTLPKWNRRGLSQSNIYPGRKYDWCNRVVRVDSELDNTGGFFVAVFTRTINNTSTKQPNTKRTAVSNTNRIMDNECSSKSNVKKMKLVQTK